MNNPRAFLILLWEVILQSYLMRILASRILCCGCNTQIHRDYRNPVEKKGWHGRSLSQREGERARERPRERADPCLDRLLLLFWHITLRMVLIYYAQVHHRWLPFTDNKGQNTVNYFKEKDVTAHGVGWGGEWLNGSHSILGRFSTDFRKSKILSKHLLPQFRVREF